MSRTIGTLVVFCIVALLVGIAGAAEQNKPRPARPVWGTVTKASAESVTIMPETPPARSAAAAHGGKQNQNQDQKDKPAPANTAAAAEEQTFALAKDQTELMFAEVGMERMTDRGMVLRTLTDPAPATAADLKAGQLVQVTPGAGAGGGGGGDSGNAGASVAPAKQIIIVWSIPATIVKIEGDTLTYRPAPRASDAAAAAKHDDADASKSNAAAANTAAASTDDQTVEISKSTTRIRVATMTEDPPAPGGRRVTSISFKDGELADLKPDQSVILCIKNDAAVKITIVAGNGKTSGG